MEAKEKSEKQGRERKRKRKRGGLTSSRSRASKLLRPTTGDRAVGQAVVATTGYA